MVRIALSVLKKVFFTFPILYKPIHGMLLCNRFILVCFLFACVRLFIANRVLNLTLGKKIALHRSVVKVSYQ